MIPLTTLESFPEWPSEEHPHVHTVPSRYDPVLEKLWRQKILILRGPPHAGKRTFGLYAVKKWIEKHDQFFYFDGSQSRHFWDEEELRTGEFWKRNDERTPVLYVFTKCGDHLAELSEFLLPAVDKGILKKNHLLITLSQPEEVLVQHAGLQLALEKGMVETWCANAEFVREIITQAKKNIGTDNTVIEEAFGFNIGSADMGRVREFLVSPFDSLQTWVGSKTREGDRNPRGFYSGSAATEWDIAAGLDVQRTQYIRTWTDEEGRLQRPWKDLVGPQAEKTLQKKSLRLVILYGHKGSGKTTLLRRMMYDLRTMSFPVNDYLAGRIDPDAILKEARKNTDKCVHVFGRVYVGDPLEVRELLQSLTCLGAAKVGVSVFLAVDTNVWKRIEGRIKDVKHHGGWLFEERHLTGQLNVQEVNDLIDLLKEHNCLFRLEHKSDAAIHFLFRKKARRGLLTCLIEATRGTEEAHELSEILWMEYQGLPKDAQEAYGFVMLFASVGIAVPAEVMKGALTELSGSPGYFASQSFLTETSEVIWIAQSGCYRLRHPLIAETMLGRFKDRSWDDFKYRLLRAWLASADLADPVQDGFFRFAVDRKVLQVLADTGSLVNELRQGSIQRFEERAHSRILNSIVRILQGRRDYERASQLCDESLKIWANPSNQAVYLRGFCGYHLGDYPLARETAARLLVTEDPHFILHGVALLCALHEWKPADKGLKHFKMSFGTDGVMYPEYAELRREVDYWLSLSVKRLSEIATEELRPTVLLDRIQLAIAEAQTSADEDLIIAEFKRLLRRQHDLKQAHLSFFSYLLSLRATEEGDDRRMERLGIVREECEYHLLQHERHIRKYPNDILSVLNGSMGRALYRMDYISENAYLNRETAEKHFAEALRLDKNNWNADNWYATFLKGARKDFEGAKNHYENAIRGDGENPVFKHNLALLCYDWPRVSRQRLEGALQHAKQALRICETDERWAPFIQYPRELIPRIASLMSFSDLKDGELLDPGDSAFLDAG